MSSTWHCQFEAKTKHCCNLGKIIKYLLKLSCYITSHVHCIRSWIMSELSLEYVETMQGSFFTCRTIVVCVQMTQCQWIFTTWWKTHSYSQFLHTSGSILLVITATFVVLWPTVGVGAQWLCCNYGIMVA